MEWQTEVVVSSLGDRRVCSNFSHRSASLGKFTLGCWKESLNKNNVDSIMDVEQRTSFGRDMRVRLTNLHVFQNGSLTVRQQFVTVSRLILTRKLKRIRGRILEI